MKCILLFLTLILTGSFHANAEDPNIVSESIHEGTLAINIIGTANIVQMGEAKDYDKRCSCRCTAQGILLRECGGEEENLGNYGNIQNCNLEKEKHPRCN